MKKIIICILSIFLIIICIVVYGVYQKNENTAQIGVDNKTYESYENKEVLGTDIISIINKATDSNKKNNIGIEKFWSNYGALSFKCTKIEYHEKTHRVKYMYFEEV